MSRSNSSSNRGTKYNNSSQEQDSTQEKCIAVNNDNTTFLPHFRKIHPPNDIINTSFDQSSNNTNSINNNSNSNINNISNINNSLAIESNNFSWTSPVAPFACNGERIILRSLERQDKIFSRVDKRIEDSSREEDCIKGRVEMFKRQIERRHRLEVQHILQGVVIRGVLDQIGKAIHERTTTLQAEGYQIYVFSNNDIYEGEWRNSMMHGRGVMKSNGVVPGDMYISSSLLSHVVSAVNSDKRASMGVIVGSGKKNRGNINNNNNNKQPIESPQDGGGEVTGCKESSAVDNTPTTIIRDPASQAISSHISLCNSCGPWIYEGEWFLGSRNGNGIFHSVATSTTYEGTWSEGRQEGRGELAEPEGIYRGEFRGGKIHGSGEYVFNNGHIYRGQWANGVFHGNGTYTLPTGTKYDGAWENGKESGRGAKQYDEGDVYIGQWLNGMRHGRGSYHAAQDIFLYDGEWKYDIISGMGSCVWRDGCVYHGEWYRGAIHGYGELTDSKGRVYVGEFERGRRHGMGHYIQQSKGDGVSVGGDVQSNNNNNNNSIINRIGTTTTTTSENVGDARGGGTLLMDNNNNNNKINNNNNNNIIRNPHGVVEYEGEWRYGVKTGRGKMKFISQGVYDGNWRNGLPDGKGMYFSPINGRILDGRSKQQQHYHIIDKYEETEQYQKQNEKKQHQQQQKDHHETNKSGKGITMTTTTTNNNNNNNNTPNYPPEYTSQSPDINIIIHNPNSIMVPPRATEGVNIERNAIGNSVEFSRGICIYRDDVSKFKKIDMELDNDNFSEVFRDKRWSSYEK